MAPRHPNTLHLPSRSADGEIRNKDLPSECRFQDWGNLLGSVEDVVDAGLYDYDDHDEHTSVAYLG